LKHKPAKTSRNGTNMIWIWSKPQSFDLFLVFVLESKYFDGISLLPEARNLIIETELDLSCL